MKLEIQLDVENMSTQEAHNLLTELIKYKRKSFIDFVRTNLEREEIFEEETE